MSVASSSAQWPGHVGYKNDWVTSEANWNQQGAFLSRVDLQDDVELGLLAQVPVARVPRSGLEVVPQAGHSPTLPVIPKQAKRRHVAAHVGGEVCLGPADERLGESVDAGGRPGFGRPQRSLQ